MSPTRAAIATCVAVLLFCATAEAAFPGANGKIATSELYSFEDGIHTLNPDGTGDAWLTPEDPGATSPAWSPDGTRIAYDGFRFGNRDIFVMNGDGTGVVRLTADPAHDGNPAWSPDGTQIVFESTRDGNLELYVMNADGSNPVRITNDGDRTGTRVEPSEHSQVRTGRELRLCALLPSGPTHPSSQRERPLADWPASLRATEVAAHTADVSSRIAESPEVRLSTGFPPHD